MHRGATTGVARMGSSASEPDEVFYAHLTRELARGRFTPFRGAGVSLVGIDTRQDSTPGTRSTEFANAFPLSTRG